VLLLHTTRREVRVQRLHVPNQVYHNTVAYSGSVGIFYFRGGCTNNTVEDNIAAFNSTDAGWDNGGGTYPSPSNNLDDYNDYISVDPNVTLGGHEVRADPQFVNPTIGDFRLQSSSPCFGKGINTGAVSGNSSLTLGAYDSANGIASQLVLNGFAGLTTAGIVGTLTVTAEDAFGNLAKSYTGTVHFTSSDAQAGLPSDYTFVSTDNGVHVFSITLKTAGTQSITASDKATATINGTQSGITVAAAAASRLAASGFPTSATAGTSGTLTVTAQDPFGNVAKSYTGTVHFTSSDSQAVVPSNTTLTSGVSTFKATLKSFGSQTITVSDASASRLPAPWRPSPSPCRFGAKAPPQAD